MREGRDFEFIKLVEKFGKIYTRLYKHEANPMLVDTQIVWLVIDPETFKAEVEDDDFFLYGSKPLPLVDDDSGSSGNYEDLKFSYFTVDDKGKSTEILSYKELDQLGYPLGAIIDFSYYVALREFESVDNKAFFTITRGKRHNILDTDSDFGYFIEGSDVYYKDLKTKKIKHLYSY